MTEAPAEHGSFVLRRADTRIVPEGFQKHVLVSVKAGLHVRSKHKRKHKPRVNRDDASTTARKRNACFCLCLRRPGSHVAYTCAYACACVVHVNQPLQMLRTWQNESTFWKHGRASNVATTLSSFCRSLKS